MLFLLEKKEQTVLFVSMFAHKFLFKMCEKIV